MQKLDMGASEQEVPLTKAQKKNAAKRKKKAESGDAKPQPKNATGVCKSRHISTPTECDLLMATEPSSAVPYGRMRSDGEAFETVDRPVQEAAPAEAAPSALTADEKDLRKMSKKLREIEKLKNTVEEAMRPHKRNSSPMTEWLLYCRVV